MQFVRSKEKDMKVRNEAGRGGIGFIDIENAVKNGGFKALIKHPKSKYSEQKLLIVYVNNYTYCIPCKEIEPGVLYLITLFPSRKYHKYFM